MAAQQREAEAVAFSHCEADLRIAERLRHCSGGLQHGFAATARAGDNQRTLRGLKRRGDLGSQRMAGRRGVRIQGMRHGKAESGNVFGRGAQHFCGDFVQFRWRDCRDIARAFAVLETFAHGPVVPRRDIQLLGLLQRLLPNGLTERESQHRGHVGEVFTEHQDGIGHLNIVQRGDVRWAVLKDFQRRGNQRRIATVKPLRAHQRAQGKIGF